MTERVARVGGRVLLFDPDDRVLLIHERIDGGRTHWLTPGGGLEDDELPLAAAVREVYEETGIRVDPSELFGPDAVLVTRREWSWQGVVYDQVDHFFAARVPARTEPTPRALTAMEQQTLLGHAWWTAAELGQTADTLVPPNLADVVEQVLADPSVTAWTQVGSSGHGAPDN